MTNLLKPVLSKDLMKIIVWVFGEILNIELDSVRKNSESKFTTQSKKFNTPSEEVATVSEE